MRLIQSSTIAVIVFLVFITSACDTQSTSSSQSNAIEDKVYRDQFSAMNKAKNVENVLMDAAQKQREVIDAQTNQ